MHLVRYWDDGFRTGLLAKETDKYASILTITASGIDRIQLPADDDSLFEYLECAPDKARDSFVRLARRIGITVRAAVLLGDDDLLRIARETEPEAL